MKSGERGRSSPPDQPPNSLNRDSYESNTHPFIVKIWLEETAEEAGRATWRGHITHVPSGEQRYLQDLDDILTFIAPYLKGMGVKPGPFLEIRLWWRRWRGRTRRASSRKDEGQ
jgi:hypothetical protein